MIRSHDRGNPSTHQGAGRDDHLARASPSNPRETARSPRWWCWPVSPAGRRPMSRPMPAAGDLSRATGREAPRGHGPVRRPGHAPGRLRQNPGHGSPVRAQPGAPRAAEADAGLVPRPGPLRRRRDAVADRVRLDDAAFLRLDPAHARPMDDGVRRRPAITGGSPTGSSSSANPPPRRGGGPPVRSSGKRAISSSGCWSGRIAAGRRLRSRSG